MRTVLCYILMLSVVLASFACESPMVIPEPSVKIIAPLQNELFTTDSTVIQWTGNEHTDSIRYRIDNEEWSNWIFQSNIPVKELDEGIHTLHFRTKSKGIGAVREYPSIGKFIVDAVGSQSIRMHPRVLYVNLGSPFTYDIRLEEVDHVMGGAFVIIYDKQKMKIDSTFTSGFFAGKNVLLNDFSSIDTSSGQIILNFAIVNNNPDSEQGVSGDSFIARFSCTPIAKGIAQFVFQQAEYRDTLNNTIQLLLEPPYPTRSQKAIGGRVIIR